MKHSEVLSRYVNTGKHIPEKQYNRISSSLQRSYKRKKFNDNNLYEWEFKLLNDNERIDYIEKKGEQLSQYDMSNLLEHSKNKDLISTKIIEIRGEKLNENETFILLKHSENKDDIAIKIILLKYSDNKDITETRYELSLLLSFPKNKELIKKILLQNGVYHGLINNVIKSYKINTPLIPNNYQSMLNEIRRIKEIMK
jgi:hypothetical protein